MKRAVVVAAMLGALGGCQTSSPAAIGADIVNNIGLACQSAQQLLALPTVVSPASAVVALTASKLASKVNLYCTGAVLAGPILLTALNSVNTAGAQLLGTGVALPAKK